MTFKGFTFRAGWHGVLLLVTISLCGAGFGCIKEVESEGYSETSFRVGFDPAQTISAAPFPSNHYLNDEGKVSLSDLGEDPLFAELGKESFLSMLSERMTEREGFAYTSPVFFFVDEEVDLSTVAGRVEMVTLSGPEAGRRVATSVFWSTHGKALGVMQAWGDYLMPDSTYGVVLREGIRFVSGERVNPGTVWPALFRAAEAQVAPVTIRRGREVLKPLREHLAEGGEPVDEVIAATVFTTEESLPFGEAAFSAMDEFFVSGALPKPSRRIRYQSSERTFEVAPVIRGEALTSFFGTPTAPFELNPGNWTTWTRENALAREAGEVYEGGSLHQGVGLVLNGSVVVPAMNYRQEGRWAKNSPLEIIDGVAAWELKTMIPFTLYLCEDHLGLEGEVVDRELPVALYTHGGTAARNTALSFAVLNCLEGIATLGHDVPFHGGRSMTRLVEVDGDKLLVPAAIDRMNEYTGVASEDGPGDYVGDRAGAITNVGELYGLSAGLDPAVVEANLLTISAEAYAFTRYIKEGDWSNVLAGLRFDPKHVFHQSQSYGTSFTQALFALRDEFAGIMMGVGSAYMVMANVPMAPSNADLGSGFMKLVMGLKSEALELQAGAYEDPVVAIHQWLSERGDPSGYLPYVLRHRQDGEAIELLNAGNSWDQTLSSFAQLSFDAALGVPVFRHGDAWTLDERLPHGREYGVPYPGTPQVRNAGFGGINHTAGMFYRSTSCHGFMSAVFCSRSYELMYPPLRKAPALMVEASPVCEYQTMAREFMASALEGEAGIIAPGGTCAELYGAPRQ